MSNAETLHAFFVDDGWNPSEPDEDNILSTGYGGLNGEFLCFAQAREEPTQLLVYSVFPRIVPPDQRTRMAMLLTWLNETLIIGNFELDLFDGQVRFKTSVPLGDDSATSNLVKALVYSNVMTLDQFLPALHRLLDSEDEPSLIADAALGRSIT
jgi:hypothetical protein